MAAPCWTDEGVLAALPGPLIAYLWELALRRGQRWQCFALIPGQMGGRAVLTVDHYAAGGAATHRVFGLPPVGGQVCVQAVGSGWGMCAMEQAACA